MLTFRRAGTVLARAGRGLLALVLATAVAFGGIIASPVPIASAAPDTSIAVSSAQIGSFTSEMLGSNLTPWGAYWPSNSYNSLIADMGMGLLRIGHGEKWYVDMESWYPAHGQFNWNAGGALGGGKTFNDQIAWWKTLGVPVMYTLNDELSSAMLNADGTLNYSEVAYAWSEHIKYLINSGVNVKYVEIGNECDIAPMEGIELPPVAGSSKPATGRYLQIRDNNEQPVYDYIRLWEAVYPAIKAKTPGVKVSAYPSGQGPTTTTSFPFDYLYETSPYKPDYFPIHVYSFAAPSMPAQKVVDSTWQYSGRFVDWDGGVKSVESVLAGWGVPGQSVGITEFNYDGGTQYASADQMWDAIYYASVMANAANGGLDLTTFWEMFAGSNTDELISDVYSDPNVKLRSQALAMRLLKRLAVTGNKVLTANVTSADNAVAYDWQDQPVSPASVAGKRVECLATHDGTTFRVVLINKNATAAHQTTLALPGLTSQTAAVETFSTRAQLAASAGVSTTRQFSAGNLTVDLPAMSITLVTVAADGTLPPPPPPPPPPTGDTTPPSVTITTPNNGATVSGSVLVAATAADVDSGVSRVEFRVDGNLVGTAYAPAYTATWNASTAAPGAHTIQATAYDGAGNSSSASVSVQIAAAPPPPAAGGTFTNDFTAGQALNTAYLEAVTSGGGTASLGSGLFTLSSPSASGVSFLSFRNAVAKTSDSGYAVKFKITAMTDGSSLGMLSMNASPTRTTGRPNPGIDASIVRSGATYGLQFTRLRSDGAPRYYNWATSTWITSPIKFSLQPNVVYIVRFEASASGQFRYVVCSQAGTPLVNGTSVWTPFASVYNDATNNYWPYVGDALSDASSGTLQLSSVSGQ